MGAVGFAVVVVVFVFATVVVFSVVVVVAVVVVVVVAAAVVAAVVVLGLKLTVLSSWRGELRMLKPTLGAEGVVMIPCPW